MPLQIRLLAAAAVFLATPAAAEPATPLAVPYLTTDPVIDGRLDAALADLPANRFEHVYRFDNPEVGPVEIAYRLAYTRTHLYLHIATSDTEVRYHRRGYLWGDGYRLLLGLPDADSGDGLTGEYYDMTFSPSRDPSLAWDRQRIAVYNAVQNVRRFSGRTRSQEHADARGSGFEALIAWADLPPYHPWFTGVLGFNLYFAKGFETEADGHFPYGHAAVPDEGIWDEEIERRAYRPVVFEAPDALPSGFADAQLARANVLAGAPLVTRVLTARAGRVQLRVVDGDGEVIWEDSMRMDKATGVRPVALEWDTRSLGVGAYTARVTVRGTRIEQPFSVLPALDADALRAPLLEAAETPLAGAAATAALELQEIERDMARLKPYEAGTDIVRRIAAFREHRAAIVAGRDPYAGLAGPYRRGFLSAIDGTYQPYGVRLPENFDPSKRYPLLVFLHGSGQDEQRVLDRQRGNGRFIEIAPLGRDRYRAYTSADSQRDIIEAVEDALRQFPIDPEQIVIGGFSMGGYGALRAFYRHPERYRGVAVFAGHPNLANEWLDGDHPNFLEREYQAALEDTPVFIYHGRKDAGLPVALAEQLAEDLEALGVDVTARFVDDKGHEYQDDETHALFGQWLDDVVDGALPH